MEVGIVGGGLIGVALAVALRERGAKVTLFERGRLGGEASTAAGGILGAQTETDVDGEPLALVDLVAARAAALDWCDELERAGHGATGLSREGVVKLAFHDDELVRLAELATWQRAAGQSAETWSRGELLRQIPQASPLALGALYFAADAHVDPPRLFAAARARAIALGVTLEEGVDVGAVQSDAAGASVLCTEWRHFERVVVAAGSWTSALLPSSEPLVKPIRGHMIELRAGARPFGPVLVGAGVYSIPRSDGRVTVGSTMEDVGHLRGVEPAAVEQLLAGAHAVAPILQRAELARQWSQFRPYAPAGLIAHETGMRNVFVFSGHHRNGILLARWSAIALAERLVST